MLFLFLSSSMCSPHETVAPVHDYVNVPRQRALVHEESFESNAPLGDPVDWHDGEDEDEGFYFR